MIWCRPRAAANGSRNCCAWSGWSRALPAATRMNFPAASASASRLRGRWRWNRSSSSATSRSPHSTSRSVRKSSNLLRDLQDRLGLAYIFVSHDLAVVKHIADRVAVMNLGAIVETADAQALFAAPRHPYSRALLSAIPVPKPQAKRSRIVLQGEMPSALNPPSGCRFHTRCPYVDRALPRRSAAAAAGWHRTCHRLPPHGGTAAARRHRSRPMAAFRRRWKNWWRPSAAERKVQARAGVDIVGHDDQAAV